jgi:DASS family divalent anion:Na+ symporter
LPIGAVSVIAIALVAITEVTRPGKPEGAIADALSGFANPLIWLIAIAVMIAVALTKTGLGTRIGYHFIALFGKKTVGVAYGLVLSELVIAPVTPSNTARGGAIIHPIMRSIADGFGSSPELGTSKKDRPLPGAGQLQHQSHHLGHVHHGHRAQPADRGPDRQGHQLRHQDHLGPVGAGRVVAGSVHAAADAAGALLVLFPPEIKDTPNAKCHGPGLHWTSWGRCSPRSIVTLGVLALMLLMWAGVPAMLLGPAYDLNATTTAMIGLSLLLLTGVLEWEDILKAKSAWDTLIWFAALVMMATFLGKLGLITWFSHLHPERHQPCSVWAG